MNSRIASDQQVTVYGDTEMIHKFSKPPTKIETIDYILPNQTIVKKWTGKFGKAYGRIFDKETGAHSVVEFPEFDVINPLKIQKRVQVTYNLGCGFLFDFDQMVLNYELAQMCEIVYLMVGGGILDFRREVMDFSGQLKADNLAFHSLNLVCVLNEGITIEEITKLNPILKYEQLGTYVRNLETPEISTLTREDGSTYTVEASNGFLHFESVNIENIKEEYLGDLPPTKRMIEYSKGNNVIMRY